MELFAFVLMPFAPKFNRRYEVIKDAIRDAEMDGERVDKQSFYRQGITDKILQQIRDADVIIADMSTHNPNVFYEVGYAHAKGKLCILLTDNPRSIPFDLKDKLHVVFSNQKELSKKLLQALRALKVETDLTFDKKDPACVAKVPVSTIAQLITGQSEAISIRGRVTTGSEVHVKDVSVKWLRLFEQDFRFDRWSICRD